MATHPIEDQIEDRIGGRSFERLDAFDDDSQRILDAARLIASDTFPYFSHGLFALIPVPMAGLGTMAVDRQWRVYIDPDTIREWGPAATAGVLVHELNHCLRDHAGRSDDLGVPAQLRQIWNVACDCAINDDLRLQIDLPDGGCEPEKFGLAPGGVEEAYYSALVEHADEVLAMLVELNLPSAASRSGRGAAQDRGVRAAATGDRVRITITADCGSGNDAIPRSWEVDDDPDLDALDNTDAALVRDAVALAVRSSDPITVPLGLRVWAEDLIEPKVDWRRVLRGRLREARRWAAGTGQSTYTRPDRRAASRPDWIFPGHRRPDVEVAVVADTSASMSTLALGQATAEINSMLRATSTREVWFISCDADATEAARVRRVENVRLIGGGGTDMRIGIAAAADLRPRPNIIVVLTDGLTPWPSRAPTGTRVIATIIGNERTTSAGLPHGHGISVVETPRD